MKKTVSNALVGIAGVHYVAAELSRRGLIALPTIRNTAGYDIIVVTPDGKKHANIQVKTSQKSVKYWPTPPSKMVRAEPDDYYVLVRWVESEKKFEGFMLKGSEARAGVRGVEAEQRKRVRDGTRKKMFPCVRVDSSWEKLGNRWRRRWETWNL
ncbi:MAG: hypothetical protein ABSH05_23445 [Bryobacteraceae bacterium]|jgi:hypothetical protein